VPRVSRRASPHDPHGAAELISDSRAALRRLP